MLDVLVVGAGFSGAVVARELAEAGREVLLIDRRPHIGGNAYDEYDEHGILVHRYGPHVFHTNRLHVVRWLSRFTDWRFYEHRVLADIDGVLYPLPINRTTINRLYGLQLTEAGAEDFLRHARVNVDPILTSEDSVLASVGEDLCAKFFRGYTRKQWGMDLAELSHRVAARIPVRTNTDDRYFTDSYQLMPLSGYTAMFREMLAHKNIRVELGTAYRRDMVARRTVYTGPIDEFYGYEHGELPYRSLRFEYEHIGVERFQPTGTVNYPGKEPYTRITEFKHLTGQRASGTTIVREYPQAQGEPFYPIPRPESDAIYQRYRVKQERGVSFVGRLACYQYWNMDQVVDAALTEAARIKCGI